MGQRTPPVCIHLTIGGLCGQLVLEHAPPAALDELLAELGGFASLVGPLGAAVDFVLRLDCRPRRSSSPRSGGPEPAVHTRDAEISLERWDFQARLRPVGPGGQLQGTGHCQLNRFSFGSLARVLWSVLLLRGQAALFHACGIRHEGGAILAPGPSGAGKTTLARKAVDPGDVLSDEAVVVRRGPRGAWQLCSTPFYGDLGRASSRPAGFPLLGIACLEPQSRVQVVPLAAGDAVMRLLGCLMCWQRDEATVGRALAVTLALTAAHPPVLCRSRVDSSLPKILSALRPFLRAAPARDDRPERAGPGLGALVP